MNSRKRCSQCKGYFPASEGLQVGLQHFCGEDCLRDYQARSGQSGGQRRAKKARKDGPDLATRQAVRERDRHCRWCGTTQARMQVHHVHFRSEHPPHPHETTNLILLCEGCHSGWAHGHKQLTQPILLELIALPCNILGKDLLNRNTGGSSSPIQADPG